MQWIRINDETKIAAGMHFVKIGKLGDKACWTRQRIMQFLAEIPDGEIYYLDESPTLTGSVEEEADKLIAYVDHRWRISKTLKETIKEYYAKYFQLPAASTPTGDVKVLENIKKAYWLISGEPSEENVSEADAILSECIKSLQSYNLPVEEQQPVEKDVDVLVNALKELKYWYNQCAGNDYKNYDILDTVDSVLTKYNNSKQL